MSSIKNSDSVAVLICGDVQGKFKSLFRIVSKLNKEKGPFEALYCVGNVFSDSNPDWELVKSEKIKAPISCYILGPCKENHVEYFPNENGSELAPNVIYLGKKGILTTTSGLKVAYLSGIEGRWHDQTNEEYIFTAKDITELQHNFKSQSLRGVDLLLTSQWPKDITKNLLTAESTDLHTCGSELISYLAVTLKPCYHFAGFEESFFERLPYRNTRTFSDKLSHTTRFIGLGAVCNNKKMQFLYGINHVPLYKVSEELLQSHKLKEVTTDCPYQVSEQKENAISSVERTVGLHSMNNFSKAESKNQFAQNYSKQYGKNQHAKQLECWFCLGSKVDEHLIVTCGDDCYVALARGWLDPDHLLIVPNVHYNSTAHLADHILLEMEDYKSALKKYFHSKQKNVLIYERNYKSPHLQLQIIAFPEVLESCIETVFLDAAAAMNIDLEEIPPYCSMKQIVGHNAQYFYLEIEVKDYRIKKFVHVIKEEFPLEFARSVLARKSLLNVPHRVDWKNCTLTTEEEMIVCKKFQMDFQQYISLA